MLPRVPSLNWLSEVYAVLDAFSQPIKQVRPPVCLPRCIHCHMPSVIHCSPNHNSFAAPSLPNTRICAGWANVPFLKRHGSRPAEAGWARSRAKQDRPGPPCGTPRSARFRLMSPFGPFLLPALQAGHSRYCGKVVRLGFCIGSLHVANSAPSLAGLFVWSWNPSDAEVSRRSPNHPCRAVAAVHKDFEFAGRTNYARQLKQRPLPRCVPDGAGDD